MLVRCTFEELTALVAGAEKTLGSVFPLGVGVAAPPRELADVEALANTDGDFELNTLEEQRQLARAIDLVLDTLRASVDASILEEYVGAENAVIAYFDYAHVLTVRDRVRRTGEEMEALFELMNGAGVIADCSNSRGFDEP